MEYITNEYIDYNSIGKMLFIKYTLKITRFIFIILHISFTVGMMWMLMCKFVEDFIHGVEYAELFYLDHDKATLTHKIGHHLFDIYSTTFIIEYNL